MPISIPVTNTVIRTTTWGIPISNEVNRLTLLTAPTPWVTPTFSNGWVPLAGNQGSQYRKIGDIVYLRGNVSSGAIGQIAFTLPVGFRPPLQLYWTSIVAGGTMGYIVIGTTGTVVLNGPANGQVSTEGVFSTTA